MRIFSDFLCEQCGTVTEKLIDSDYKCIECPECLGNAIKQLSAPQFKLDGTSGDFPGEHMRWARIREENAKIKAKRA